MPLRTEVVQHAYQCEWCEAVVPVSSFDPKDMPEGYFLQLRRVTAARNHSRSGLLFFCTKDCLLEGLRYQASALMQPVETPL